MLLLTKSISTYAALACMLVGSLCADEHARFDVKDVDGLRIRLQLPAAESARKFPLRCELVLENVGASDLNVNLGLSLANGKSHHPTAIRLLALSKGKTTQLLTPTTFSLIHATDFADRYERQLVPLLRAGYLVLCDRYVFTAYARDIVRGCPRDWVRGLYDFAALPDLTFFFKARLEVSLQRILDGRPELKYFEAGMDLGLSSDPYESFRIFQGRMLEQYLAMSTEFKFLGMDANQPVEPQQAVVRQLVAARIDLGAFVMGKKA